jgi:hypothetical protein
MKLLLPLILATTFVVVGCGKDDKGGDNGSSKKPTPKKVVKKKPVAKKKNPNNVETPPQLVVARTKDQNLEQSGEQSFKTIEFRTILGTANITDGKQAEANFNKGRKVAMETQEDQNQQYGVTTTRAKHYWHFPVATAIGRGVHNVGSWLRGYQPRYMYNNQWYGFNNGTAHSHKGYRYFIYRSDRSTQPGNCNNGGFNGGHNGSNGGNYYNQPTQKYYPNQGNAKYYPTQKKYSNSWGLQSYNNNYSQNSDTYFGRDSSGRDVFVESNGRKYIKNSNGTKNYNVNSNSVNRDSNYQNRNQVNNQNNNSNCR